MQTPIIPFLLVLLQLCAAEHYIVLDGTAVFDVEDKNCYISDMISGTYFIPHFTKDKVIADLYNDANCTQFLTQKHIVDVQTYFYGGYIVSSKLPAIHGVNVKIGGKQNGINAYLFSGCTPKDKGRNAYYNIVMNERVITLNTYTNEYCNDTKPTQTIVQQCDTELASDSSYYFDCSRYYDGAHN